MRQVDDTKLSHLLQVIRTDTLVISQRSRGDIRMNSKKNTCDRDEGCRSNRRDFNATLVALLISACAPLALGSGPSSDRGRWILNERDR
jgi:hypothetical protein